MTARLFSLTLASLLALAPLAEAQRASVEVAQERCAKRTQAYADTPRGMEANYPDRWAIRSTYRQCFHGYTGRYPTSVPEFKPNGFFTLNGLFGLRGSS